MVQNKRVWKGEPFFCLVLFLLLLTAFPVSSYAKGFVKENGYYYGRYYGKYYGKYYGSSSSSNSSSKQ